jgi:hypothetical protein
MVNVSLDLEKSARRNPQLGSVASVAADTDSRHIELSDRQAECRSDISLVIGRLLAWWGAACG